MIEYIGQVMQNIVQPINILAMIIGVACGIIVGALPGLSSTLGVALALPFTFALPPDTSIILLVAVYCSSIYGGSISAVLIKTPGTPASAMTALDGFVMTQQGRPRKALSIALRSSVIGGLISGLALLFFSPMIAKFAINFGPPETFALTFFGLSIISAVSGDSLLKGLVMAGFGLLFSTVGMDIYTGLQRFNFGSTDLLAGIPLLPTLIGAFAVAEIMNQVELKAKSIVSSDVVALNKKEEKYTWKEYLKMWPTIIRSSIIGIIIGATPGTGCGIASALSYNITAAQSKNPEKFGKGAPEGITASEAANNGATGATMIPALTLGIPGDTTTAVMMGALVVHGLRPGPLLFANNGPLIYTIILGFFVVNIMMYFQGKLAILGFSKIVKTPTSILMPTVLVLCMVGAFANNGTVFGVILMLFFGIFGYVLGKFGFPMVPMLIALVLGPIVEFSMRQSLEMGRGSLGLLFSRPISLVFIIIAVLSILYAPAKKIIKKARAK